jgi:hypothetical protein
VPYRSVLTGLMLARLFLNWLDLVVRF